jgi:hypothetical protein
MTGDAMLAEVVKALIVANAFLETDLEKLKAASRWATHAGNCLRPPRHCRVTGTAGMIEV